MKIISHFTNSSNNRTPILWTLFPFFSPQISIEYRLELQLPSLRSNWKALAFNPICLSLRSFCHAVLQANSDCQEKKKAEVTKFAVSLQGEFRQLRLLFIANFISHFSFPETLQSSSGIQYLCLVIQVFPSYHILGAMVFREWAKSVLLSSSPN